jgi:hypothetical protein
MRTFELPDRFQPKYRAVAKIVFAPDGRVIAQTRTSSANAWVPLGSRHLPGSGSERDGNVSAQSRLSLQSAQEARPYPLRLEKCRPTLISVLS